MTTEHFAKWLTALAIVIGVAILLRVLRRTMKLVERKQWLPPTLKVLSYGFLRWSICIAAALYVLEILGLPVKSLWAGLLSAALLVAVAFVAAWSVLSNILSALLLLTFSRARVGDIVELKDTKQDEVGVRGTIIDINLFFVTIEELFVDPAISNRAAIVQIPCHLFFYRVTRCWAGTKTQPLREAFNDEQSQPDKPD